MKKRCATLPLLTLISYDREWEGVSPSSAGNGPRMLYLKATTNYAIDPNKRIFAILGTAVHEMLAKEKYTNNVLAEEPLSDEGDC